jgi:hypothetical protein
MAEIKSTLELIMERTRNLTMTDEEKETLKRKEAVGKANGSAQKYLDGLIGIGTLKAEMESAEKNFPDYRKIMETALLEHLNPESENRKIFDALEQAMGIDAGPLRKRISRFQDEIEMEKGKISDRLNHALADRHISGSAVLPNPARDETMQSRIQKMKEEFRKEISPLRGN